MGEPAPYILVGAHGTPLFKTEASHARQLPSWRSSTPRSVVGRAPARAQDVWRARNTLRVPTAHFDVHVVRRPTWAARLEALHSAEGCFTHATATPLQRSIAQHERAAKHRHKFSQYIYTYQPRYTMQTSPLFIQSTAYVHITAIHRQFIQSKPHTHTHIYLNQIKIVQRIGGLFAYLSSDDVDDLRVTTISLTTSFRGRCTEGSALFPSA